MWNCFVRCRCCRNATAFLSASDVDTVIKVNYDHSVCLDPITIIISISRQTIIGGGNGSSIRQEAASVSTTPSSRPASQPANPAFLPVDRLRRRTAAAAK